MSLSPTSALLDTVDDLVIAFDSDGRLREWNQAVVEATGLTCDELTGATVLDCFEAGDAGQVVAAIGAALEAGTATVEAELVTPDTERIPYEFKLHRVADDGDDATRIAAIGRELTDRHETERNWHELLDRMSDGFYVLDTDWRITHINEFGTRIVAEAMGRDLDAEELVGRCLWEVLPDVVDTPFYEKCHEAMATQEPVSLEASYPPLGKWFEVQAYPSETGLAVYFHDITERREQRSALERREQVLREMHEVIADRDRSFTEQVEALLELGRHELGTAYGTLSKVRAEDYVFEVVSADDDTIQAGDTVPLSATNCEITASSEQTLVLGDVERDAPAETDRAGYTDWGISCYIGAPVYDGEDVYGTFCFYDTDPRTGGFDEWEVTLVDLLSRWVSYELERRETNRQLQRQNEKLDRFASMISHDLRNPLNVLTLRLEMAARSGDPAHFEHCRRATDRMEGMIEDLLSLARAGETIDDPTAVSIDRAVERCWGTVETQAATLSVETEQTIAADESRLRQLLENLIRNSVEHGGADVTITIGDLADGFYVADDGPGIPEDDRSKVFEDGYTTNTTGTGIGLMIVEEIADAHGWQVSVTSGAEGGARFEFTGVTEVEALEA